MLVDVPLPAGNQQPAESVGGGLREVIPTSGLVCLTHGAVAAGRAEVANTDGDFANPVGAAEDRMLPGD